MKKSTALFFFLLLFCQSGFYRGLPFLYRLRWNGLCCIRQSYLAVYDSKSERQKNYRRYYIFKTFSHNIPFKIFQKVVIF